MPLLLPTAYLPPINYISECFHTDSIIIEVCETYPKQTFRNHCLVYGPNGIQQLTIPVNKVNGNHTMTRDIRISYFQDWQKVHWRSIETAYNNSPFFLYYKDYFEPYFIKRYDFLVDFNSRLLETIFIILRMEKEVELTEEYLSEPLLTIDLRQEFFMKKTVAMEHPTIRYTQVFEERHGFLPNLSVIDLIFNLGPEAGTAVV